MRATRCGLGRCDYSWGASSEAQGSTSILEEPACVEADAGSGAGELVAKASIEVPDPSFDVVLRRGEEIQHIFFRW
jgi:hypothetical protein